MEPITDEPIETNTNSNNQGVIFLDKEIKLSDINLLQRYILSVQTHLPHVKQLICQTVLVENRVVNIFLVVVNRVIVAQYSNIEDAIASFNKSYTCLY